MRAWASTMRVHNPWLTSFGAPDYPATHVGISGRLNDISRQGSSSASGARVGTVQGRKNLEIVGYPRWSHRRKFDRRNQTDFYTPRVLLISTNRGHRYFYFCWGSGFKPPFKHPLGSPGAPLRKIVLLYV